MYQKSEQDSEEDLLVLGLYSRVSNSGLLVDLIETQTTMPLKLISRV